MNNKQIGTLFYIGTLISSVGSFAFNLALIAFMLQSGFDLAQGSLIIGLQRFVPMILTSIWGHLTDTWPAKTTVVVAEVLAALTSIGLFLLWKGSETTYLPFAALCVLRSCIVTFQVGSRSKISKYLADGSYKENSKQAIWLNKATQGATLFGGLFAWLIIQKFSLETAILFDAATFVLNGVIVLMLPSFEAEKMRPHAQSWFQKFIDLYSYNKRSAILDFILAITMMGTIAFMSRVAGENHSWSGFFMASFGLAVWVSGYLERGVTSKFPSFPYWLTLGGSFILLSIHHEVGLLTLLIFFIKDLSYWVIHHRISSHIQMDTPVEKMGGVASARAAVMILTLATGEMLVGLWSSIISISHEAFVRGLLGVAVGVLLLTQFKKKVASNDRPEL